MGLLARVHPVPQIAAWRTAVMVMLHTGYMSDILCRSSLSAGLPAMKDDASLGLSESGAGALLAIGTVTYLCGKLSAGPISDVLGARRISAGALAVTIVFTAGIALSSSPAAIAVLWSVSRFAQSAQWPAAARVIRAWFDHDQHGTCFGVIATASRGGAILAAILGPVQQLDAPLGLGGWRASFWFAAALAVLPCCALALVLRDTPEQRGLPPARAAPPASRPQRALSLGEASDVDGGTRAPLSGAEAADPNPSSSAAHLPALPTPHGDYRSIAPSVQPSPPDPDGAARAFGTRSDLGVQQLLRRQQDGESEGAAQPESLSQACRRFVSQRDTWLIALANVAFTGCMEVQYFLPLFLSEATDAKHVAAPASISAFALGAMLSALVSGRIYDRKSRRTARAALLAMLAGSMAAVAFLAAHLQAAASGGAALPAWAAFLLVFLHGLGIGGAYFVPMSVYALRTGGAHVGLLVAGLDAVGYLGALVNDLAYGRLVEHVGWQAVWFAQLAWLACGTAMLAAFLAAEVRREAR